VDTLFIADTPEILQQIPCHVIKGTSGNTVDFTRGKLRHGGVYVGTHQIPASGEHIHESSDPPCCETHQMPGHETQRKVETKYDKILGNVA
jgi:hypothetical protein